MKICDRLDYSPHIQPIKLNPTFPDSVFVSKIGTFLSIVSTRFKWVVYC